MQCVITFLSDFGLEDGWVPQVKSVIKSINPCAKIIDISHHIPSFNVKKGAFVLAATLPFMPRGIHLAVVDPSVGTKRKAIALRVRRGDILVGPDNGLFIPAALRLGGVEEVVEVTNRSYMLPEISFTFHARDVFAPVCAYLSRGTPLENLGRKIRVDVLQPAPWGKPYVKERVLFGEIIDIDKFGTLRTNFEEEDLKKASLFDKSKLLLKIKDKEFGIPRVKTFGEVDEGKPLLLFDSSGYLSLAVNKGDASKKFLLKVGDRVTLR